MTLASLTNAVSAIQQHCNALPAQFLVETVAPEELLHDNWAQNCCLLVMPGGRDLPYLAKLRGAGNQRIKDYVHNGGSYLGLCAGGYYGSAAVEFAKGDPILEVTGPRELGFFPGVARGPVHPGFHYIRNTGVKASAIRLTPAAVLMMKDMCPDEFRKARGSERLVPRFYFNGGCSFVASDEREVQPASVNGLHGRQDLKQGPGRPKVLVLGEYHNVDSHHEGSAAMVQCHAGEGTAVLSGVHIETSPGQLAAEYKNDSHVGRILLDLSHSEHHRELLFNAIVKYLLKQALAHLK